MVFYSKDKCFQEILKFQKLDASIRWVFADELLHDICLVKNKNNWGFYGNIIKKLIKLSLIFRSAYLFLGFLSFLMIMRFYLIQILKSKIFVKNNLIDRMKIKYLYFSFGAAKEVQIYKYYSIRKKRNTILKFQQNEISNLIKYQKVGIGDLIFSFSQSMRDIQKALKWIEGNPSYSKNNIYTSLSKRLAYYSFMKAWFLKLKNNHNLNEICFPNADIAAYASIASKIKTRYIQHGLISNLILFPDFNIIETLSKEEQHFFKNRFSKALIKIQPHNKKKIIPNKPPNILIVSSREIKKLEPSFFEVLSELESMGCNLYIKLHPREKFEDSIWSKYNFSFQYKLLNNGLSFEEVIEKIKPRITILWHSTAILDLVYRELIVASLYQDNVYDYFVYPIKEHSMDFLKDIESIKKILFDDDHYEKFIKILT